MNNLQTYSSYYGIFTLFSRFFSQFFKVVHLVNHVLENLTVGIKAFVFEFSLILKQSLNN
jgi:hypothetical protein